MKKLLLTVVLIAGISFFGKAQGVFKLGANVGLASSDALNGSDLSLGVDAYYMFGYNDAFLSFGPTVGYRNFFIDNNNRYFYRDDAQFVPVAGAARVKVFGIFTGGIDVGYAFGISDYLDGGFYVRPIAGIDVGDFIEINVSYENYSDRFNWGNANVGVLFQF
ncbi:hypothetical protein [Mangrovimonas sp. DI 80]|uniref:hypothetical protein n=1 Tax=Mangrovimonas sp. DI 80 TaxID=1779330 RepID=UPI000977EC38|nr:hypothetical protein [Mangrovimonas sp. DI 80]OMP30577.1 hypothetical protein BKM32_10000 [Mangrovimonas sp. DI 80]